MYYRVLIASQRYHGNESLTYSSVESKAIGQIVKVPLGNINVLGILISRTDKPTFAVKSIIASWDVVVPKTTAGFIDWLYAYYPAPLGSITELFTPPAMPQTIEPAITENILPEPTVAHLPRLTTEQTTALEKIHKTNHGSILLHGDTGSGKTRLYLELAVEHIRRGKSVIITTPEIGLTKPLVDLFTEVFGQRVFVTHSAMTPATRRKQWLSVAQSSEPIVLVGPRSALFLPVSSVGLIIIDESHDTAYKQDQSPYYQATRVAAALANMHHAQLVLGTATPLVSDFYLFEAKGLPVARLTKQAVVSDTKTNHIVVDARDRSRFTKSAHLSNELLSNISQALQNGEQSLLFLNRRGSARVVLCQSCGWRALCPRCDSSLTFHADSHNMRCHSCDFKGSVPSNCVDCSSTEILFKSIGTKALEEEVSKYFPSATVARFDGDTHQSQGIGVLFQKLKEGSIDIIIGTQAIAKGFDLPKLSVVGVVQADMSLSIPDYTATERTYQLLSQVSGRIGRGHRDSTLIIQTHNPDSVVIAQALNKDYNGFYHSELAERKAYRFPPFAYLMTVTCTRSSAKSAESACTKAKEVMVNTTVGLTVDGPTPKFLEKTAGKYSWQLVVRSKSRNSLLEAIKQLPAGCIPNLDPTDLL